MKVWERKREEIKRRAREGEREGEEGDIASLASHGMAAGCWLTAAKERNTVAPTLNMRTPTSLTLSDLQRSAS